MIQIPDPGGVRVTLDGEEFAGWRPTVAGTIELDLRIGEHELVVRTGYHGPDERADPPPGAALPRTGVSPTSTTVSSGPRGRASGAASVCWRCC